MNRDICATNALQSLARREIVSIALMNHDFPASSSLYPSAYGALPWLRQKSGGPRTPFITLLR
ncbi:hypothetical protein WCLP8_1260006 [uncultured Gammaproteobacteria bacterium]